MQQHDVASPANQARLAHGLEVLARIDGDAGRAVLDGLADVAPALGHHIAAFAFGDIYDRPGLDPRSRQLVTHRRANTPVDRSKRPQLPPSERLVSAPMVTESCGLRSVRRLRLQLGGGDRRNCVLSRGVGAFVAWEVLLSVWRPGEVVSG